MKEADYQHSLKKKIEEILPEAIILKNDPNWLQGIPDLTVLNGDKWAMLEVKTSKNAKHQANQDYYVDLAGKMSYSWFVYPENESEVLDELQQSLGS